jgi:hypothetical protein
MKLVIHEIIDDKRYPNKIKYSLIFIDKKNGRKVLIDNHHPKGHHLHLDDVQVNYIYKNDETLIEDFKKIVFEHFGERI